MGVGRSWMKEAACQGADLSQFFPKGGRVGQTAVAFCSGCTVRQECLDFALANEEVGVWGGTSLDERQRMGVGGHDDLSGLAAQPWPRRQTLLPHAPGSEKSAQGVGAFVGREALCLVCLPLRLLPAVAHRASRQNTVF